MNVAIIQHVKHEPAGSIETFLEKRDIQYEYFRVYEGEFPEGDFTHYVIMGGPMGAYEDDKYPFKREVGWFEVERLEDELTEGLPSSGSAIPHGGDRRAVEALGKG